MHDAGEETADRVDILAGELTRAGHDVSVRDRGSRSGPSTPDVVHALGWGAVAAVGAPGEAAMVASLDVPGAGLDPVTLALGQAYDRVIATSSESARELVALGLRRDRIGVVPDGVDADRFNPGPAGPRLHGGRPMRRILCVRPNLRPGRLLDAMTALLRVPDAGLFVAGGPPPQAIREDPRAREVALAARRIGVAKRVFLLGDVPADRKPDLYRAADAVMLTGEPGAAQVALEAMACAAPVAAYAQGAVVDIVTHGVSGVLVERGNTYALATAVRGLFASEPRRYAYAVAGLSRVLERFTWPRVAEQIEGFYRAAIADRQGRPVVIDS